MKKPIELRDVSVAVTGEDGQTRIEQARGILISGHPYISHKEATRLFGFEYATLRQWSKYCPILGRKIRSKKRAAWKEWRGANVPDVFVFYAVIDLQRVQALRIEAQRPRTEFSDDGDWPNYVEAAVWLGIRPGQAKQIGKRVKSTRKGWRLNGARDTLMRHTEYRPSELLERYNSHCAGQDGRLSLADAAERSGIPYETWGRYTRETCLLLGRPIRSMKRPGIRGRGKYTKDPDWLSHAQLTFIDRNDFQTIMEWIESEKDADLQSVVSAAKICGTTERLARILIDRGKVDVQMLPWCAPSSKSRIPTKLAQHVSVKQLREALVEHSGERGAAVRRVQERDDDLQTVPNAAKRTGISQTTLWRWMKKEGPHRLPFEMLDVPQSRGGTQSARHVRISHIEALKRGESPPPKPEPMPSDARSTTSGTGTPAGNGNAQPASAENGSGEPKRLGRPSMKKRDDEIIKRARDMNLLNQPAQLRDVLNADDEFLTTFNKSEKFSREQVRMIITRWRSKRKREQNS
jgi:hypothetical protein